MATKGRTAPPHPSPVGHEGRHLNSVPISDRLNNSSKRYFLNSQKAFLNSQRVFLKSESSLCKFRKKTEDLGTHSTLLTIKQSETAIGDNSRRLSDNFLLFFLTVPLIVLLKTAIKLQHLQFTFIL